MSNKPWLTLTFADEEKSKIGEVFSDRLLVDYPYLLFARTLQVMKENKYLQEKK
jgi:hypothetical protein